MEPPRPPTGDASANGAAKSAARASARQAVARLSRVERAAAAAAIAKHLIDWPVLTAAKVIMAFAPLDDEPDLSPLLGALIARGTTVCIPQVDWFSGTMRPVAIESMDRDLALSRLNLREPRSDLRPVTPGELDLVLVPGLAFDQRGGRLGRGKGFYDRFLRLLPAKTATCGVCFFCQLVEEVPMELHDVRLGALVHDRGLSRG